MSSILSINHKLLRLGGTAGIWVGLFIFSFAIIADGTGIFLTEHVFEASIGDWIHRVQEHGQVVRKIVILPIQEFSSMFVMVIVLYQLIAINSWQKNLALACYLVGVPLAVYAFVSQRSLINQLLLLSSEKPGLSTEIELIASFSMAQFMVFNAYFGPFFIVIMGIPFLCWAALKSQSISKWLCYWGIFTGILMTIGYLSYWVPTLGYAGIAAPLRMLWFLMVGIFLFQKSSNGNILPVA